MRSSTMWFHHASPSPYPATMCASMPAASEAAWMARMMPATGVTPWATVLICRSVMGLSIVYVFKVPRRGLRKFKCKNRQNF